MTVLAALAIGAAIGWTAGTHTVWQLAEAVRYWTSEAQAAERDVRLACDRRNLMLPRGIIRPHRPQAVPRAVNSLPVRALTGTSWWPGWRDT